MAPLSLRATPLSLLALLVLLVLLVAPRGPVWAQSLTGAAVRVPLELTVGVPAAVTSAVLGALVPHLLCNGAEEEARPRESCARPIYLSALAAASVGTAGAVWGTGRALDGTGRFGWTLLGAAAGGAVGAGLLLGGMDRDNPALLSVLSGGLILLGSVLAFELSGPDAPMQPSPLVSTLVQGVF